MNEMVYYLHFQDDAQKFSKTGTWTVLNPTVVSSSSDQLGEFPECHVTDGLPEDICLQPGSPGSLGIGIGNRKRHFGDPTASLPEPDSSSSSSDVDSGESRCGKRPRSGLTSGGPGDIVCLPATVPSQEPVSLCLEQVSQGSQEKERTPDSSSENADAETVIYCLLFTGGVNSVKCLRHRQKRTLRHSYKDVTTTFQYVGDVGNERKGPAMVLMSFHDETQRDEFFKGTTWPAGVKCQRMTMKLG